MQQESSYKLLLVDADKELLKMNATYFGRHGYAVVCAENATAGVDAITAARFDCVLLDIDPPDGDGFAVCAAVAKTPICRSSFFRFTPMKRCVCAG